MEAQTKRYLEKGVLETVQYVLSQVLYEQPGTFYKTLENPREYMIQVLKQLKRERGTQKLVMFNDADIKAYFHILDVANKGYIDMDQYLGAFKTLGLKVTNQKPEGSLENKIKKETFVYEISTALFYSKKE